MTHYLRHLDYLMLATVLSISAFGLWIMRTATQNYAGNLYGHQLVYVAVGTVGMMLVAAVPPADLIDEQDELAHAHAGGIAPTRR
jgi:cell division protein FtsW (lipid II flippase)